ncbi:NAD-dependent epimerase/dehydratase family protein [Pseudochryseolinea flava]|uniref:Epimerase n=1 Tax=Pseudochryseolinea flava TaxID=2059302 RepID=A0A364XTV1_9BACT|nr:NAD-dependent epimerase/dehydratase family protein [Pseudochryseolinea flava]RAV97682.1 epimerase [Pseudochryseolinea flava]
MIAVTGANGLLGSFIVRQLITEEIPFVALKRKGSDISLLDDVADKIQWRDADVLDVFSLQDAFVNITHVIHTAAIVSFNGRRAQEVMDINVVGTRNVVNTCIDAGVKRLIHVSSVAALGRQKGQTFIDENHKWVDSPLNSTYAKSKYLAELEVARGQEEGLSTVTINPSVILAPADWRKSSAQLFKYVWDQRAFYLDAYLNYVDVRDVAAIAVQLLDSPIEAQRFIVSSGKISFYDFFKKVARFFNKKSPSIKPPRKLLHLVAGLERMRTWFTKTEPLITSETVRLAGTEFLYNNKKVRMELDFEFQPIDTTLHWCCQYYIRQMGTKN